MNALDGLLHGLIQVPEKPDDFVLQVAGKRVFLTRDMHITRFEVV